MKIKHRVIFISVKLSGSSARQPEQNYYLRKTTSNIRAEWRPLVCLNQTPFPVLLKHNSLLTSETTSCSLSHCCNFAGDDERFHLKQTNLQFQVNRTISQHFYIKYCDSCYSLTRKTSERSRNVKFSSYGTRTV